MKLAYITTISTTQHAFLNGQNRYMRDQGFELHAMATPDEKWNPLIERDEVIPHPVSISREITPFRDLVTLWKLYWMTAPTRQCG